MAATFTVEVELSGVGAGWTAITGDLVDTPMRTARGFQSVAPDDLVAAPMTWVFSLDNSVHNSGGARGYYSPDATAAVRSGWALGIRARLTITANGHARVKAFGWVEAITPLAGTYDMQTVEVLVIGWLAHAATASVATLTPGINQRGDQLTAALAAKVTFPPPATAYATGIDTYPYAFDDLSPSSSVLDGLDSTARSGFDRIYERSDGALVFENRQTRQAYQPAVLTFPDVAVPSTPTLAIMTGGLPARRSRQAVKNHFQVTTHPKQIDAAAVVLYAMPISAYATSIPAGQTITILASYVDPSQLAQQVGGFNMLISDGSGGSVIGASGALPVGDYKFTTLANGGGTDISGSVTVTVVYGTTQATITMVNAYAGTAYVAKLQCRGQGIYNYQTAIGVASNSASEAASGQNTYPIDCPYQPNALIAQSAALWCAAVYSPSLTQLDQGLSVFIHADDEVSMDALLQREISDPVAVTETVTGLAAGMYWLNSEAMEIDERCNIKFTYSLAPMPAGKAWSVGVSGASELGVDTFVGYF